MEENKKPDDGSLAFLNIPRDESNRSFNCDETTQSKLVNTSFWVCDFIEDVPTRFSKTKGTKGQTLVKIKPDKNSPEALRLTVKPHIECTEYADDITFYAESKAVLHEVLKLIRVQLEDGLSLKIKGNYQIFPVAKNRYDRHGRALDYVGYKFFREQKLMRKSIKQNFCREAARLNKREKPLSQKAYKQAVCPWLGWAKHSNSRHLLKTIIKQKYYGIL